jgi:DNA polymerase III sliding clamp (beta) subunit (PCNA family)
MKIELPCGVAVNMFKALDGARANDKLRLALTGVNWEIVGGVHTFTATDSYRLHTVSITDPTATYQNSVLLSSGIVKAVQVCAKAVGKTGNVVLALAGDSPKHCFVSGVNVASDTVSRVTVECLSNEYPTCRSIIDGATDIELPALFNGKYLGDLVDVATLWAGKDSPVTVESVHATKPSRIVSANDYGTFTGVLMPQRGGK